MLWCESVAPLGKPVVPLVYWMLIGSSNCRPAGSSACSARSSSQPSVPMKTRPLEFRAVGGDLLDHRDVVGALEVRRCHEQLAAGLVEDVLEFGGPVGGVDVDEHDTGLGRGELHQHPLGTIGRPDAHTITGGQSRGDQAASELVDPLVELGVGPADVLVADDERLAVPMSGDGALEVRADRLTDQRRVGGPVRVGQRHSAAGYGSRRSSACTAGPSRTEPSTSKREPWHGQSQLVSAALKRSRQPRWVQRSETPCSVPSGSR